MGKDYYKILGVDSSATDAQIKKAYQGKAVKWHPDKHQDKDKKEEAAKKITEINEAYEVLSDPEKRKMYDDGGTEALEEHEQNGARGPSFDPFGGMFQQVMGQMGQMSQSATPNLEIPFECTLADLYTGFKKDMEFQRMNICDKCDGNGVKDKKDLCRKCKGKGMCALQAGPMIFNAPCQSCAGAGFPSDAERCKKCNGKRCYSENVKVKVNVPAGAFHKFGIVVENEGHQIPPNEVKGDKTRSNVIFFVDEKSHETFKRGVVMPGLNHIDKSSLYMELDLTFAESIVGFEKSITHLDGKKLKFSKQEPVRHGDLFVLKDQGMPIPNKKDERGVLYVKLNIDSPESLSTKVKKDLWNLLSPGTPYPKFTPNKMDVVNFSDYRDEVVEKVRNEQTKSHYRHKMKMFKGFPMKGDDDSDDEEGGGQPECAQQ